MIENKDQNNESRLRSVGIKTLSCQLDEYIRLAASGDTILVTDRDLVVAEIVPRRENRSPVLADAPMADAVRSGMLTPPTLSGTGLLPVPKPVAPIDRVLQELEENRRDR
ncbi:MAG: prevent-host-death protein [Gammaproteobacteria bacterium]|nr:prevent-host-death protein [Gammaproteobacteria bacterium]